MALTHKIADIRRNYSRQALTEDAVLKDPVQQYKVWLQEAITAEVEEATAFVLSTVNAAGQPSARVLLLKDVDEVGFTFFTNYDSRKGKELAQNPLAAITFFWASLERQVRIEGRIEQIPPQISDAYFHSRPKGSQIGAWASPQSQEIGSRHVLEESGSWYTTKFADAEVIPRPSHWGGYRLIPTRIEFWQGRPDRLHDRIEYQHTGDNWILKRLAP